MNEYAGGFVRGHDHLLVLSERVDGLSQLNALLRHETFAHYAFDSLDPERRQQFYDTVTEALLDDPGFKDHYLRTLRTGGYDQDGICPDNIEEYFAILAESPEPIPFSQKLLQFIRDLIRETFPNIANILGYNENDARYFLEKTAEGLATGSLTLKSQNERAAEANHSFVEKHGLKGFAERVRIVGDEKNARRSPALDDFILQ